MFYQFRQNNSGGGFDVDPDEGIGVAVIIEADDLDDLRRRAEDIGLYWGYRPGDCPDPGCCGVRWSLPWDDPDDEPKIYDTPVAQVTCPANAWHDERIFVHYKDGHFDTYDATPDPDYWKKLM